MLGSAAGWLGAHRIRGVVLLASLLATAGAAIWTATPVSSAGQLVDTDGSPVPDAEIALAAAPFAPAGVVRSDGSGRYEIGSRRWPYVPPRLTIRAPGFVPIETAGGRLVLHRWPEVTGKVVDDLGAPLAGAVVLVSQRAAVVDATMTDLDGRYALLLDHVTGAFSVSFAMEQHDLASQEVSLGLDQQATINASLVRQLAILHLESDPGGQVPTIDGNPAPECQGTPCDVTLLAGQHRVAFTTDLYLPWTQDVELPTKGSVTVRAALQRKTGTLAVTPPFAGELSVDGQSLPGGGWTGKLPTGKHLVALRSPSTWPAIARVDVGWDQTTDVKLTAAAVGPGDAGAFLAQLRAYLAAMGGSYGVYLEDLAGGSAMGASDTAVMEAASVIKVPTALYLLRQVDAGLVALSDQIDLHDEDFMPGTGSLIGTAHAGDRYAYQDLLALLIQQSDNTAWRALNRVLGVGNIDAYAAGVGAGDCRQGPDACSARSAGHLLAELARGRLLSTASTQRLMGLLESTIFNDRINFYLGGLTIAHKVGMLDDGVRNDCGVVLLPARPFAVCMFTNTCDPYLGIQAIRDVARAAAKFYGG